jgi:hypothetical protein
LAGLGTIYGLVTCKNGLKEDYDSSTVLRRSDCSSWHPDRKLRVLCKTKVAAIIRDAVTAIGEPRKKAMENKINAANTKRIGTA